MCGIVGYTGKEQAQSILLNALSHLEYRGYDSSGIAVKGDFIQVYKDKVRVGALREKSPELAGTCGIGHTRWATHGEPSQVNAHPHGDCHGKIFVVHNGIITNYQALKDRLIQEGHRFGSETDTEVIAHLIEKYYDGDIESAVATALKDLKGSYAIAVLTEGEPALIAAKNGSPLIIGVSDSANIIASDIPALLDYTDRVSYLEDGDLAVITADGIHISNNGKVVERLARKVGFSTKDVQKGGYEHFMLKEIHEQPRVIRDTIQEYYGVDDPQAAAKPALSTEPALHAGAQKLLILACGTSYHAGLVGKYIIEDLLDILVRVDLASEVNHRDHMVFFKDVIAITQSGETADVLYAMKQLKEKLSRISVITNVYGSSASRAADKTIYTQAGPEMSVAATKSFIAQLVALYQLTLSHPGLNAKVQERLMLELRSLPTLVQRVLDNEQQVAECARFLAGYTNAFFIGRGINYPIAMEGALKLKEISYIHAEGYAAGELKHGPFSLLQPDTPVVAIVAPDKTYDSMLTSIKEVKSRKSPVIAIVSEDDVTTEKLVDQVIRVPHTLALFSPVVNAVALQLLAYYTAKYRGCPIDFPRNLAKSVTVE
jgi:glutamine---fructose-6-phosphate transaminase (isomerizing)